jgi:pimeloyl-ACP methyl ester carboxylesterase
MGVLEESLQGIDAPIETKWVTSADGTRIAAFKIGTGPKLWVSPPAMGAPLLSMKRVFEPLARKCTILTWDMRGFFASDAPDNPEAYAVGDHLADMEAVLDAFDGPKSFVLGGWSMGVQLSLESVHRNPERVNALLLVSGPYQRALQAVLPGIHPIFARGLRRAYSVGPAVTKMVDAALRPSWVPGVLSRTGLLARDPALFTQVIERFRQIDWGRYLTVMRKLHEHDAEPYLSDIRQPALVVCGTRDLLTPLATAKRMNRLIAGSELFVIPKATHYIVVEFGELVASRIERFLDSV